MTQPARFRHRYRISSSRSPAWAYDDPGWYFITICTKPRKPWFGNVRNGRMELSDIGRIVDDEWHKTGIIRPYISLDTYVVMPDHFHTLIRIHEWAGNERNTHAIHDRKPGLQPHSMGSIINQFKSACTKRIRDMGHPDFSWQTRYYDSAVRDAFAIGIIRRYIRNNPRDVAWKTG
jgi:putative transposase